MIITFQVGRPFARAVTTYGLASSSNILLRKIRIPPAVPEVPITTTGAIKWTNKSHALAKDHGAYSYSPEKSPPTATSKYAKKIYISTRPNKKSGIDIPMNPTNVTE